MSQPDGQPPLTPEEAAALQKEIQEGAGDWTVTAVTVNGVPLDDLLDG